MFVTASEVKARGAALFDQLLQKFDEVVIQVRGKPRFVVMDTERYEYLRELELEAALREAKEDIEAGRTHPVTVDEHLKWVDQVMAEENVSDCSV